MAEKVRVRRVQYELCNRKQIYLLNGYKFRLKPEFKPKTKYAKHKSRKLRCSPDSLIELATDVVRRFKLPESFHWTCSNVQRWIESIGYAEYKEAFKKNFINGHTLILVDACALSKMNIKNHLHIRSIAKAIRKLYGTDTTNYFRDVFHPFHNLWTQYLLFFASRAPHSRKISAIDFWKKYQILQPPLQQFENHWKVLENWLKNPKLLEPTQRNLIGCSGMRHSDLYRTKQMPKERHKSKVCNSKWSNLLDNMADSERDNDFSSLVISSLEYEKRMHMMEKAKITKIISEKKTMQSNECICDADPCRCLSLSDFTSYISTRQPRSFIISSKPTVKEQKILTQNELTARRLSMNIGQEAVREKLLMVLPTITDCGDD